MTRYDPTLVEFSCSRPAYGSFLLVRVLDHFWILSRFWSVSCTVKPARGHLVFTCTFEDNINILTFFEREREKRKNENLLKKKNPRSFLQQQKAPPIGFYLGGAARNASNFSYSPSKLKAKKKNKNPSSRFYDFFPIFLIF